LSGPNEFEQISRGSTRFDKVLTVIYEVDVVFDGKLMSREVLVRWM
jgi:hypothetical protein